MEEKKLFEGRKLCTEFHFYRKYSHLALCNDRHVMNKLELAKFEDRGLFYIIDVISPVHIKVKKSVLRNGLYTPTDDVYDAHMVSIEPLNSKNVWSESATQIAKQYLNEWNGQFVMYNVFTLEQALLFFDVCYHGTDDPGTSLKNFLVNRYYAKYSSYWRQ